ncbi:MAG: PorT family protein, partial [Bacteroidota bacterium]
MIRTLSVLLLLFYIIQPVISQDTAIEDGFDDKYLEDQIYIGIGYNFLLDKPEDVIQRNLSYSLQLGLIKDIPLNQKRNFGLGIG